MAWAALPERRRISKSRSFAENAVNVAFAIIVATIFVEISMRHSKIVNVTWKQALRSPLLSAQDDNEPTRNRSSIVEYVTQK